MPTVLVPTAYRGPTSGQAEVIVEGATVRECLHAVEAQFPHFIEQVLDAGGNAHRFVKLFVNEEQIDDVDMAIGRDDRVEVLAAIAGGSMVRQRGVESLERRCSFEKLSGAHGLEHPEDAILVGAATGEQLFGFII